MRAGEVESPKDATQLAWRLTNTLRAPFTIGGTSVNVTASIGVAYSDDPQDAAEDIIRKADATMYLAKRRGRSRVEVHGVDVDSVDVDGEAGGQSVAS